MGRGRTVRHNEYALVYVRGVKDGPCCQRALFGQPQGGSCACCAHQEAACVGEGKLVRPRRPHGGGGTMGF